MAYLRGIVFFTGSCDVCQEELDPTRHDPEGDPCRRILLEGDLLHADLKKKNRVLTSVNVTKLAHGGPENFRNPRCNGRTPGQHQNVSRKRHRSSRRRELGRSAKPVTVSTDQTHNLHFYTRCVRPFSMCDVTTYISSLFVRRWNTLGNARLNNRRLAGVRA